MPYFVKIEGSNARDHLANERTLCAWLRTAFTLMGLGLGISLLKEDRLHIKLTAFFFSISGMLFMVMSIYRYFTVMNAITKGEYVIGRGSIIIVIILAIIAFISSTIILNL